MEHLILLFDYNNVITDLHIKEVTLLYVNYYSLII